MILTSCFLPYPDLEADAGLLHVALSAKLFFFFFLVNVVLWVDVKLRSSEV